MRPKQLRTLIYGALEEAKGRDVVFLDVRKISGFTDYMVIATGTSTRHVASMADKVIERMRAHGRKPGGVEGLDAGDWVLVDFGEAVVHLMRQQTRDFYALEKLWADGKVVRRENGVRREE